MQRKCFKKKFDNDDQGRLFIIRRNMGGIIDAFHVMKGLVALLYDTCMLNMYVL